MKIFFKSENGCVMRRQKRAQYLQFLMANGHEIVNRIEDSDVCIMWTCAAREESLEKSLEVIDDYKENYKGELIVAGCLPDIAPDKLKEHFNGFIANWKDDVNKLGKFFGDKMGGVEKFGFVFTEARRYGEGIWFNDQFGKMIIAEGCNYKCAFCAERQAFPPFHSFPEKELVEACRKMVEGTSDYNVMLLADSVGLYGTDTGSNLPLLIEKLKAIHPEIRIALSNLNPACFIRFFDEITDLIKGGIIKHLSLPVQSASTRILELMNRDYTRGEIDKIFNWLNNASFADFDTHALIGFPGETEEDIDETIDFIIRHKPRYVYASKYLEMPATARFDGKVDEETKEHRLQRFTKAMKDNGIICSEECELVRNRFLRNGG